MHYLAFGVRTFQRSTMYLRGVASFRFHQNPALRGLVRLHFFQQFSCCKISDSLAATFNNQCELKSG